MKITYIHHSGFLVETDHGYYLFDYESGVLPALDSAKPMFVLSSHSHSDHYNPEVFSLLADAGMAQVLAVLSDDISAPKDVDVLQVSPGKQYDLGNSINLTTFRSTDLGVAFLVEDHQTLIYHAGDLNDWVWDEETDAYNQEMTHNYRKEMGLLVNRLNHREIDVAFVVLDPRQEADYDRGLSYFLEHIPTKQVYPMHYWDAPEIIETFLADHLQYAAKIQKTE